MARYLGVHGLWLGDGGRSLVLRCRDSARSCLMQELSGGILAFSSHPVIPLMLVPQPAPTNVLIRIIVGCLALVTLHPETEPIHVTLEGGNPLERRIKRVRAFGITIQFRWFSESGQRNKQFKGAVWGSGVFH